MKNNADKNQSDFDLLNSPGPLPREYYSRVPEAIRESYRQASLKMRALPAKKAGAAFKLAVTLWKPIATALREDFEKQQRARTLPPNMKFTDYFVQFQRAADLDFSRTQKAAKAKKAKKISGGARPRNKKKCVKSPRRKRK